MVEAGWRLGGLGFFCMWVFTRVYLGFFEAR